MKRFILSILIFLFTFSIQAQELGLHFIDNIYQSTSTNPGKMSQHRITVGLPSIYLNYSHNGPTIDDMLYKTADGSFNIDIDKGLKEIGDNNYLRTEFSLETFNVGVRINKIQVGLSHAVRFNTILGYPRELAEMAFNGNSQYIDQDIEVAPSINSSLYGEIGLHGAYQITDKLSAGIKIKLLSGLGNISTHKNKNQLSIYTDPDYYQLTATTDYQINTAADFFYLDIINEVDSTDFNLNPSLENISTGQLFFGGEGGIAFDIGAEYKVNDKLTLGFSALDLGSINWNNNASNFTSEGVYTFEGINANEVFFGEDSIDFDPVLDTIVSELGFVETNNSYKTSLSPKFYLSGSYDIQKSLTVGAVLHGEILDGRFNPALGISVQKRFGNIFSLGGIYSMRNKSFANLGVNFVTKLGPIQLYAITDNIISVIKPYDTKNVNFRVGFNVAISKKREKKSKGLQEAIE